jgi:hypothetical protein
MSNIDQLRIEHTSGGEVITDRETGKQTFSNREAARHRAPTTSANEEKTGRLTHVISRELGRAVPANEAKDTDLVNVGSMQVSVRTLIARGDLVREQDGSLRAVSGKPPVSAQEKAQAQQRQDQQKAAQERQQDAPPAPEAVSPEVEKVITEVATGANPSDVLAVVNTLGKGQEPGEAELGRIASKMGVEPEQVAEKFETVRSAMEGQALRSVGSLGIDAQDIMTWGYENCPDVMKRAINQHATQRSTKGYQEVAKQFVENLDTIDPASILEAELPAGWSARIAGDRKTVLLVSPEGREHSYRALAKAGKVKVSPAGKGRRGR